MGWTQYERWCILQRKWRENHELYDVGWITLPWYDFNIYLTFTLSLPYKSDVKRRLSYVKCFLYYAEKNMNVPIIYHKVEMVLYTTFSNPLQTGYCYKQSPYSQLRF